MELVHKNFHVTVAHKGAASAARAETRAATPRGGAKALGALTVYLAVRDALQASGVLHPDYEVVERETYHFAPKMDRHSSFIPADRSQVPDASTWTDPEKAKRRKFPARKWISIASKQRRNLESIFRVRPLEVRDLFPESSGKAYHGLRTRTACPMNQDGSTKPECIITLSQSNFVYEHNRISVPSLCSQAISASYRGTSAQLEERIKVEFPLDYRKFLLEFNGGYFNEPEISPVSEGCPLDALTQLNGIGAPDRSAELGEPVTLGLFDDNDPPKILAIGDTAMGGLIILDTAPGEERGAIYLKQAFGDFYYLAKGIEEFFSLLRERTLAP